MVTIGEIIAGSGLSTQQVFRAGVQAQQEGRGAEFERILSDASRQIQLRRRAQDLQIVVDPKTGKPVSPSGDIPPEILAALEGSKPGVSGLKSRLKSAFSEAFQKSRTAQLAKPGEIEKFVDVKIPFTDRRVQVDDPFRRFIAPTAAGIGALPSALVEETLPSDIPLLGPLPLQPVDLRTALLKNPGQRAKLQKLIDEGKQQEAIILADKLKPGRAQELLGVFQRGATGLVTFPAEVPGQIFQTPAELSETGGQIIQSAKDDPLAFFVGALPALALAGSSGFSAFKGAKAARLNTRIQTGLKNAKYTVDSPSGKILLSEFEKGRTKSLGAKKPVKITGSDPATNLKFEFDVPLKSIGEIEGLQFTEAGAIARGNLKTTAKGNLKITDTKTKKVLLKKKFKTPAESSELLLEFKRGQKGLELDLARSFTPRGEFGAIGVARRQPGIVGGPELFNIRQLDVFSKTTGRRLPPLRKQPATPVARELTGIEVVSPPAPLQIAPPPLRSPDFLASGLKLRGLELRFPASQVRISQTRGLAASAPGAGITPEIFQRLRARAVRSPADVNLAAVEKSLKTELKKAKTPKKKKAIQKKLDETQKKRTEIKKQETREIRRDVRSGRAQIQQQIQRQSQDPFLSGVNIAEVSAASGVVAPIPSLDVLGSQARLAVPKARLAVRARDPFTDISALQKGKQSILPRIGQEFDVTKISATDFKLGLTPTQGTTQAFRTLDITQTRTPAQTRKPIVDTPTRTTTVPPPVTTTFPPISILSPPITTTAPGFFPPFLVPPFKPTLSLPEGRRVRRRRTFVGTRVLPSLGGVLSGITATTVARGPFSGLETRFPVDPFTGERLTKKKKRKIVKRKTTKRKKK